MIQWSGMTSTALGVLLQAAPRAVRPPSRTVAAPSTCECAADDSRGHRRANVSDCCCTHSDLERIQLEEVHPLLQAITRTPFFAHFKVNLCSECTLWSDTDALCILEDCGVGECESPPAWAATPPAFAADFANCGDKVDDQINVAGVSPSVRSGWTIASERWVPPTFAPPVAGVDFAHPDGEAVVVDLRSNPERYTGYAGTSAARVWEEIHGEWCSFHPASDGCRLPAEQRVYNRLLSGLHASISLHIAHSYCLEHNAWSCVEWGRNASVAHERVLRFPERVENVYFTFALLLRAVVKAGDAVGAAVPSNDELFGEGLAEWRTTLLPGLVSLSASCPLTFDESAFFRGVDAAALLVQLRRRIVRLHKAMECVGCERCRLWGTLQALGIDVATRLLFPPHEGAAPPLMRQEAVALVNTLERLSSSLAYMQDFQRTALRDV